MLPLLHVVTESILCLFTVKNTFFCLLLLNQSNRRWFLSWTFLIYEFLNENQSRMFRCLLSICSYQKRKIKKLDLVWAPFLTVSIFWEQDHKDGRILWRLVRFHATTLALRCWRRRSCSCWTWNICLELQGEEQRSWRSVVEPKVVFRAKSTKPAVFQSKTQTPGADFKLGTVVWWPVGVSCLRDAVWAVLMLAGSSGGRRRHMASWCRSVWIQFVVVCSDSSAVTR